MYTHYLIKETAGITDTARFRMIPRKWRVVTVLPATGHGSAGTGAVWENPTARYNPCGTLVKDVWQAEF